MVGSEPLLRAYARMLREAAGAERVSIYLPAPAGFELQDVLIHEGPLPDVPELADPSPAQRLRERFGAAPRPSDGSLLVSSAPTCRLFRLPALDDLLAAGPHDPRQAKPSQGGRRRDDAPALPSGSTLEGWVGLRYPAGVDPDAAVGAILRRLARHDVDRAPDRTWTRLLAVGGSLAWHNQHVSVLLREPVSRLPGRTVLQAALAAMLGRARVQATRVALLLVNPDGFTGVNERFGREAGDQVIREMAERLRRTLRSTDSVCHYGGAVFGAALPDAGEAELSVVVDKLRRVLSGRGYLDGALRMALSFGAAIHAPTRQDDPHEAMNRLVRRADRALNAAKLAGGGGLTIWRPGRDYEQVGQFDRLSGIFTANQTKDYRNMMLLWDTVRAVASAGDVDRLVTRLLERLLVAFRPQRIALIEQDDRGTPCRARWTSRGDDAIDDERAEHDPDPDPECRALLDQAREQGRTVERELAGDGSVDRRLGCAVPVRCGDRWMGGLYLEGDPEELELDSSDHILLQALAGQLAVTLDRARLVEQERLRLERERRGLRQELNDLRQVLGEVRLAYRSSQIEQLLAVARRAAPTDATVLICGESGTGKELFARTVHELSRRRDRPLVVVDCSAIATTLIDSELFGHERGAYTGAQSRAAGRLADADQGTILLDEIGELPLEVQGKLLRFVQEKQLTPVGSTRSRRVDVRVIAATNRDLAAEVAAGRFREDLYYRLKVIQLEVPPLRERPEDITLLARHFIEKFALQYGKGPRRLTPQAETRLLEHPWPGNVRELQNRLMQTVILSEREEISASELGLDGARDPSSVDRVREPAEVAAVAPTHEEAFDALQEVLGRRIVDAIKAIPLRPVPIGKWVTDDLILRAHAAGAEVASRAAQLLGVPETTFRRRLRKAKLQAEAGLAPRPADWAEVRERIDDLLAGRNPAGEDLLARIRAALLDLLAQHAPGQVKLGATFMGVTEPTFKRWATEPACAPVG